MIDVTNCAHVDMRFISFKFFFGHDAITPLLIFRIYFQFCRKRIYAADTGFYNKTTKLLYMALLWSPYPDLNWGPLPYQGSALPLSYMGIISTLSRTTNLNFARHIMERVKGIEPSYSDWKSEVLPLNYTRKISCAAGYQLLIILSNQLRGRFSSEPN